MRIALASSSCSAWLKRSAATNRGFAVSSARTRISLGPAMESMLTFPIRLSCKGNVDVSRSYDFIDFWNALGSVSKGCNCLCTADFKDAVRTGFFCCRKATGLTFPSLPHGVVMQISLLLPLLPEECSSEQRTDTLPFLPERIRRHGSGRSASGQASFRSR